jgi:acyl-CoA synthetase (AMP-forming)/AMP-acid ligase II
MNVGLATTRSARRYGDRLAVFDGERSLTWRELDARSNRLANLLREGLALARGARVALLAPNRLEVAEVLAGIAKAGMVYVGLNFRMSASDLGHVMENAEPELLIVSGDLRELADQVAGPRGIAVLDLDEAGDHGYAARRDAADDAPPASLHEVRPEDDFCIVYTSGTTGTPKGVWFDHGRVLQHATVACLEYELDADSRYLIAIPHNSSVNITLVPCMTIGAAVGFLDTRGFDPAVFADAVEDHGVTHSYLVPTQLYRLLDQLPADTTKLRSIVTLGYGAAPMSPDRAGELVERFGPVFNQLYGMAEVASIGTMLRKQDHVRALDGRPELLRSAGQPSYVMDVRVVDDDGNDVATGERGEVIFAAPYMMKGYYRDPERTAGTLVDGWIHSGDIAEVDEDGYLYVVDRKKDLIIRGGYNLSPTEVEAALLRHPAVLEAGVIGVPDPEWGEAVCAVVAARAGAEPTADELIAWCRETEGLPTLKTPERVEFVDSLPKNAVGKIDKVALREDHWTGERKV